MSSGSECLERDLHALEHHCFANSGQLHAYPEFEPSGDRLPRLWLHFKLVESEASNNEASQSGVVPQHLRSTVLREFGLESCPTSLRSGIPSNRTEGDERYLSACKYVRVFGLELAAVLRPSSKVRGPQETRTGARLLLALVPPPTWRQNSVHVFHRIIEDQGFGKFYPT